jgi:hypothetical protein
LDGDGLGDFSYTYWFDVAGLESSDPNPIVGPFIAGDPNAGTAPGIEDVFDVFTEPNYRPSPGYIDPNLTHYRGTYWFGSPPIFAQFYMELFAPGCASPGASGNYCSADIDGSFNCLVNLSDLVQLLSHYGITTGATRLHGDVEPTGGDGDVDLCDLVTLLAQYGDDCN